MVVKRAVSHRLVVLESGLESSFGGLGLGLACQGLGLGLGRLKTKSSIKSIHKQMTVADYFQNYSLTFLLLNITGKEYR